MGIPAVELLAQYSTQYEELEASSAQGLYVLTGWMKVSVKGLGRAWAWRLRRGIAEVVESEYIVAAVVGAAAVVEALVGEHSAALAEAVTAHMEDMGCTGSGGLGCDIVVGEGVVGSSSRSPCTDSYRHCTFAVEGTAGAGAGFDSGYTAVFSHLAACLALPADDDRSSCRRGSRDEAAKCSHDERVWGGAGARGSWSDSVRNREDVAIRNPCIEVFEFQDEMA